MKWLLWREFRLNGLILIAGAVLLLLPFVLTLIIHLWPKEDDPLALSLGDKLDGAALFSCVLSQLTVVLLGGNAFAGERADRSAEFMAYLPVSRERRLVTKLILALIVTAIIWGMNLLVLWRLHSIRIMFLAYGEPVGYTALTGLVMFGVAWFISSLQSSPTFAVCGGIAAPLLILTSLRIAGLTFKIEEPVQFMFSGYVFIGTTLGVIGFSIGIWDFLKRVEP